jgi:hypothetical protein
MTDHTYKNIPGQQVDEVLRPSRKCGRYPTDRESELMLQHQDKEEPPHNPLLVDALSFALAA